MDVLAWAKGAEIGERITYCERSVEDIGERLYSFTMSQALLAHNEGLVFLAQRRTHQGFAYEATRISRPVAEMLGLLASERGLRRRLRMSAYA